MSKINEYTKVLNEESAEFIKKIKADQVRISEIVQRMKRLEQSAKPKEETPEELVDKINANVVSLKNVDTEPQAEEVKEPAKTKEKTAKKPVMTKAKVNTFENSKSDDESEEKPKQKKQQRSSDNKGKSAASRQSSKNSDVPIMPISGKEKVSNYDPKKNTYQRRDDDNEKRVKNKKQMIKQTGATDMYDDERVRNRKVKKKIYR